MGCCGASSGQKDVPVSQQRRRLSIGQMDGETKYTEAEISDEDRGIITTLDEKNILEMLESNADDGRKFSIGSETDEELAKKETYGEKKIARLGSPVDPNRSGIGFACKKGLKPESPNQDSWVVLKLGDFSIYGVFDGHGKAGHRVSNFVKEALPKLIVKHKSFRTEDMAEMLKEIYKRMQNMIVVATRMAKVEAHMSGCTTTVLIHDHAKNRLYVSWAGDSGACIGTKTGGEFTSTQLTWDHKPDVEEERQRIERAGGRVVFDGYANHRVYAQNGAYPGLNMSRALGDLMGHADAGISAEPTVKVYDIQPQDHVLIICSDGVWEFLPYDEAVRIVADFPASKAMEAAGRLAKEGWERWVDAEGGSVVDDITALVVYLGNLEKAAPVAYTPWRATPVVYSPWRAST